VRPLSQKLLPDTLPIRKGWVKKEEMLDISGRGRHRQMQLAEEFGIKKYQNPGGGCLLTDKNYSQRLADLMKHEIFDSPNIDFLKVGRHFRLSPQTKLIIGRNEKENEILSKLVSEEITLQIRDIAGPLGVINSVSIPTQNELETAAAILLRYANKADEKAVVVIEGKGNSAQTVTISKMESSETEKFLI